MAVNERVNITVTSSGTVRVKRELDDVGSSARKAASGVDLLQGAFTGWLSGNALSSLVRYADTFTNINNRLKIVTKSSQELTSAQNSLYRIAQDTYQAFESTATIYARTATATSKLGYSSQQALNFTKQLSQSVALSGVSAESANQALVQLSQGLASGTLRGEELNSLLEQLPYAAQTLAQGLGVTVGKLRELGAAGLITPKQIIDAFNKMSTSIAADFAKMTPTISQGLQVLENGFIRLLGLMEQNTGVFGAVGQALAFLGNNMEMVALAATPVIAALTVLAVQVLGNLLISAMTAATAAIISMVTTLGTLAVTAGVAVVGAFTAAAAAVSRFTVALLTNPVTLLIAAITAAVVALGVAILKLTGTFDTVKEHVTGWARSLIDYINKVIGAVKELLGLTEQVDKAGAKAPLAPGAGGAGGMAGALKDAGKDIEKSIGNGGQTAAEKMAAAEKEAAEAGAAMYAKSMGRGGGDAAKKMEGGMAAGGAAAASTIETAIKRAFNVSKIGLDTGGRISMEDFGKAKKTSSKLVRYTGNTSGNPYYSGNTSSMPDGAPAFANGGSMRVGGSGGTDSQMVQFRATPNEHVTVETPAQRRANNTAAPVVVPPPKVQIINQIDPRGSVDAMQSRAGRDATRNNIRADAEQIRRILGV